MIDFTYLPHFLLFILGLYFEFILHQHIVNMGLGPEWMLAIYFNLMVIISGGVVVFFKKLPIITLPLFSAACPIIIGYYVNYFDSRKVPLWRAREHLG